MDDEVVLKVEFEPRQKTVRLNDSLDVYLTLVNKDQTPIQPGKFDPGSVVVCTVGDTPDLDAAIVSYVPWIIPFTRRLRVWFKKAQNPVLMIVGLSSQSGIRKEKRIGVSVFPLE